MMPRDNSFNDFESIRWQRALAGPTPHPHLSLLKTEQQFHDKTLDTNVFIHCTWDVDSVFIEAKTLVVHKHGFNLAYCLAFLQHIVQNPCVTIQGEQLHKLKQLQLSKGTADGGFGYKTHVFFPNMDRRDHHTTHLSNKAQSIWIDAIILPALHETCDDSIIQAHSQNFQDANNKTKASKEVFHNSGF